MRCVEAKSLYIGEPVMTLSGKRLAVRDVELSNKHGTENVSVMLMDGKWYRPEEIDKTVDFYRKINL